MYKLESKRRHFVSLKSRYHFRQPWISKELMRECVTVLGRCCCCMPLLYNHLMDSCSYRGMYAKVHYEPPRGGGGGGGWGCALTSPPPPPPKSATVTNFLLYSLKSSTVFNTELRNFPTSGRGTCTFALLRIPIVNGAP